MLALARPLVVLARADEAQVLGHLVGGAGVDDVESTQQRHEAVEGEARVIDHLLDA